MKFLQTENEKKSFTITSLVFVLLFLLFFLYKFTSIIVEPPVMGGEIAINFGTTEKGKGPVQPTKPIESAPQPEVAPKPVKAEERVVTQKTTAAPVVKTTDQPKVTKEEAKPVKVAPKPTPSKSTNDALASIINGPASKGDKEIRIKQVMLERLLVICMRIVPLVVEEGKEQEKERVGDLMEGRWRVEDKLCLIVMSREQWYCKFE